MKNKNLSSLRPDLGKSRDYGGAGYSVQIRIIGLILFAAFATGIALVSPKSGFAQVNIDKTDKFAWSENSGWHNWYPTYGGVTVNITTIGYLSGYAWAENIGWVRMGAGNGPYTNTDTNNYGVNVDADGRLSGYGWSETCGWISFCTTNRQDSQVTNQVTISGCSFNGYAWAENVGWVHFKNASPAYNVRIIPAGTIFRIYGLIIRYLSSPEITT